MKNRLTSHLLSGLAAAAFFAMPALAQDAAPATTEAVPATEQPATEEAKPAVEEAQPVAEQPKAEESVAAEKTEAPAAAQEQPAEQTAAAQPAEEPKAEEAAAPAENTNPGEVANAAGNALDMLKASMNEGTSEAKMKSNIAAKWNSTSTRAMSG